MPGNAKVWLVSRASCIEYRNRWDVRHRFQGEKTPPIPWSARNGNDED
jgi:hypothetical protein